MLAAEAAAGFLAVMLYHAVEMLDQDGELLGQGRIGLALAGGQIMGDLARKPRTAIGTAPDHGAVRARQAQHLGGVLEGIDVAIADHRDRHRFLDLADEAPVGMAVIELVAGAAMHGDHLHAGILGDARQGRRVAAVHVPAGAHLQRHRQVDRLDHRRDDVAGQLLVAHQRRAGIAIDHLLHRTAHIDVDDRGAAVLVELGGFRHHLGLAAGQLNRHGEFLGAGGRHLHGLAVGADHGLAGDHLGHDQAGAAALGQATERHVRDT